MWQSNRAAILNRTSISDRGFVVSAVEYGSPMIEAALPRAVAAPGPVAPDLTAVSGGLATGAGVAR